MRRSPAEPPATLSPSSLCCQLFEAAIDAWLANQPGYHRQDLEAPSFEVICRLRRQQELHDEAWQAGLQVGLSISDLARSTARFELALFVGDEDKPLASGQVVRVFIARTSQKPALLDAGLLAALDTLRPPDD